MSIEDRDWIREERPRGFRLGDHPVHWVLIGATALAFLLQSAAENGSVRALLFFQRHLYLSLDGILSLEVWQAATYSLLHDGGAHLLVNLFGLFLFGAVAEEAAGRRGFLLLWGGGVLGGAAGHLLWSLAAGHPGARVLGASGAVMAVLVFAALRAPRRPFAFFLVLPVPLYLLAAAFVAADLVRAATGTAGRVAVEAHLGGAAAGAILHAVLAGRGRRRGAAAPRPSILRSDLPPDLLPPPPGAGRRAEEARVDALLDRIHASGIGSLTEEERAFLNEVSRRLRGRR